MVRTADKQKKIGLLGGTFDPVHNGHLGLARHVLLTLKLDSIWFIPAALPPHKDIHADGYAISSFEHRFAMVKRAIVGNRLLKASDIEVQRSSPSYSIDTIKILRPKIGDQTDLFFIIGLDAFLEIETWKRYKELPSMVNFVIISRPGYLPDRVGEVIDRNFMDYIFDHHDQSWTSPVSKGKFILQHMEPIPISSTEIREKVGRGDEIFDLVPGTVEEYIKNNGLYLG